MFNTIVGAGAVGAAAGAATRYGSGSATLVEMIQTLTTVYSAGKTIFSWIISI
jgi:hypothetical protein